MTVVELVVNQTTMALELLTCKVTQIRAAVLQNRMALDYLSAAKRGICDKFNQINCCLQISDYHQVILELSKGICQVAYILVQNGTLELGLAY